MRALDRSVEFQFALRNVAGRALVVADLRAAGMIGSGGKVHVVVAGSARDAGRVREISSRLRGAGILLVAHFAAARIRGKDDGRVISHATLKPDDLVRLARLDAGQFGPMWILWTITGKSTVLPVSGSVVCGVWQSTHISMPRRDPPCADNWS